MKPAAMDAKNQIRSGAAVLDVDFTLRVWHHREPRKCSHETLEFLLGFGSDDRIRFD
jgi:hypothetical protein